MLRALKAPLTIALAAGTAANLVLAVTGCGGSNGVSLEGCLNGKGFLVQGNQRVVRGSSTGGVSFTLTVYASPAEGKRAFAGKHAKSTALIGSAVVDFTGNPPPYPGGPPAKLSKHALATIRSCLTQP